MPTAILSNQLSQNLWRKANGIDPSPVVPYSERKSISTEPTFDRDSTDMEKLRGIPVLTLPDFSCHFPLSTFHFLLSTFHSSLFTLHSSLFTFHYSLFTYLPFHLQIPTSDQRLATNDFSLPLHPQNYPIMPTPGKRSQALMADLFDTNPDKVLAALQRVPEAGNASFVLPLLKTYLAWEDNADIRGSITKILYELKTAEAIPELLAALDLPEMAAYKAFIISIFWNAGIIPTELDTLVRHAIQGDYMTAFEVLTVVEQMDTTADADTARDLVWDIEEYLDEHPDADHVEMLQQLRFVLIDYSNL